MTNDRTTSRPDPNGAFWLRRQIPELCYTFIEGAEPGKRIGIIKRGESGYHLTDYDRATAPEELARETVEHCNARLEVTKGQAEAMSVGSMFGWNVPGADATRYDADGKLARAVTT